MIWSWQLLRAGTLRLDGGGMFGVVPKVLWQKMAPPDELNRIGLQTNCLLVRRKEDATNDALTPAPSPTRRGETVLIETGCGGKWSDKERDIFAIEHRTILDALHEINIDPASLTHVIVSHLHFDHAGGLTHLNDRGEPTSSFPNARIIVQRREWEDAVANRSTMTRTYLPSHLDPVADQLQLADGVEEVLPGITVEPAPGHTWGQQMIRFEDERGVVCFPGDVLPTANHVGLAFSIGYDMEPYTNMLTKKALLERAAAEDWRIAIDHEPGNPIVRVRPHPERAEQFVLEPQMDTDEREKELKVCKYP